jgi:hypothetical protein
MGKGLELSAIPKTRILRPDEIPHILEVGEFGAVLEWAVSDTKTGKVFEHVVKKSESYVQQFLQLLFAQFTMAPSTHKVSVRDTGNTLRDVYAIGSAANNYLLDVLSGAGVVTFGIVGGTGNAAPTISDYALGTLIAHGAGAGQLNYGAVSFGAPASDATTSQLTITRNLANASGGGITVEEVGLYCRAWDGAARYFMLIRDVTGGILVPNGQTLTVNYRPQATV